MAQLRLEKVQKRYGTHAEVIKPLDLQINSGEFVVVVGPSGCGKSTLLRLVAGLEEITDGDMYIDEPLSNLDASLRVQMRMEIAALHRRIHATILYVTHDQVEAMTLADRIVVLNQGQIEQVGTPLELYDTPANVFVAQFIGSPKMNLIPGKMLRVMEHACEVELENGLRLTLPVQAAAGQEGDTVQLGIRPEHVEVMALAKADVEGEVLFVEHMGNETLVYVNGGYGAEPLVMRHTERLEVRPEHHLGLKLPVEHCYLFDSAGNAFARLSGPKTQH
ncbi:TOBE domain-containing protein [Cronobacter sakazakii]|uniref:ABC transporter ATP-binding protein n=1 Tax=Cronobacter sakazakii TaxID=28141 RepID=UPI000BEAA924|nr:ATP-binding cassette domain-containing protein [Cronobacter sakazakii]PQV72030.1 TOBE domain-containing protein [Cronobacter sakazakii]